MSTLFGPRKKKRKQINDTKLQPPSEAAKAKKVDDPPPPTLPIQHVAYYNFDELGLAPPLQTSCQNLGMKTPTQIQQRIVPLLLQEKTKSILAISPTGSGKTAAYTLPILHNLSVDPYGIYAIVLVPTRELAKQVQEQILALGSIYKINCTLVVGGCDVVQQSIELSNKFPHFVVATPGRFSYLLRYSQELPLQKCRYLVLDEADQLLTQQGGFEADVAEILLHVHKSQILLFSATMTKSLEVISRSQFGDLVKIIIEEKSSEEEIVSKLPAGLVQEYLFMPSHVRDTYLVATIKALMKDCRKLEKDSNLSQKRKYEKVLDEDEEHANKAQSVIIFTSTCERTAHLTTLFSQLHLSSIPLHSLMSQTKRFASLAKFKSRQVPILIATDIASRGLDIPTVDLVLNIDLPQKPIDYIHRVGRTARAGRRGKAISFVNEHNIQLLHSIEALTSTKLSKCADVSDKDALDLLNAVSKASRLAKMKLNEVGFDDLVKKQKERKKNEKKAKEAVRKAVKKQLLKKES